MNPRTFVLLHAALIVAMGLVGGALAMTVPALFSGESDRPVRLFAMFALLLVVLFVVDRPIRARVRQQ